jgi:L-2,4-diaminobutyrate decarboxylase
MALHAHAERSGFDLAQEGLQGFPDLSRLVLVTSTDAHFSMKHAVRTLGLGERALVTVPVEKGRRMDVAALERALAELSGEREVFCVVATAGTTSTGSVDPVGAVADLCAEEGPWLHVDGAYGLAYALVPEWRHLFEGLERADSLAWDPHKQMAVPIPSSILFARRGEEFRRMALFSDYWNRPDSEGPNPGMKSMPSTRPLAALPLVTSIRHQGVRGVAARLRHHLEAIRGLADVLRDEPDVELLHEPDTGILCFRLMPSGVGEDRLDDLQERIYQTILGKGERMISVTTLGGRRALRLVALSPAVTTESMLAAVDEARRIAAEAP